MQSALIALSRALHTCIISFKPVYRESNRGHSVSLVARGQSASKACTTIPASLGLAEAEWPQCGNSPLVSFSSSALVHVCLCEAEGGWDNGTGRGHTAGWEPFGQVA